jgi:hypothetical protein
MRPPETSLTSYGSFELLPMAMGADVAAKPEKVAVANDLGQKLDARLRPMIKNWESSAPTGTRNRTLVIKSTVTSLRVISGGARFWGGSFSGDSFIDLDLVLIDKETGAMIANQRINKNANSMAGAWSFGSSDKNLLDYVVDIAYQYLAANRKQETPVQGKTNGAKAP